MSRSSRVVGRAFAQFKGSSWVRVSRVMSDVVSVERTSTRSPDLASSALAVVKG